MDSRPKGNRKGGYGMVLESLSSMNRFEKMKTKEEFHLLIDSIEDENLLRAYYELVRMLNLQEEREVDAIAFGRSKSGADALLRRKL